MSEAPAEVVDLRPRIVHILLYRADGWTIPFQFKPGGTPASIADYEIKAQIRETADSDDPTELTVNKTDAAEGRFTVSQTQAGVMGWYDIEFTKDGASRTYIAGQIDVKKDVTRP